MTVYKSKDKVAFVANPTVSDGILHIYGFAEYHISSLAMWIEKKSDWLCIDAGNDLYVKTDDIKKYIPA